MTYPNNMCLECNIPLELKNPRPGQTFKPFMGCPNYRNHKVKAPGKPAPAPTPAPNSIRDQFILEEVQELRKELKETNLRLDKLGEFLVKKLG